MGEQVLGERLAPLVCTVARAITVDEEARTVRHVISTGSLDRMNRMVEPSGWRLSNYRENPIVMADHEYSIEKVIGNASETRVEGDALVSTTKFAKTPLGEIAFRLVQAGIVRAWSVGWIGLKAHRVGEMDGCSRCAEVASKNVKFGTHFTQQELLEYSLVAIPANRDAVMGLKQAGLVTGNDVDAWMAAVEEAEEKRVELATVRDEVPARSAEFLKRLFDTSRDFRRRAATLDQIRRLKGLAHGR